MRMTNICVALSLCMLVLSCGMGKERLSDSAQGNLVDQKSIYGATSERQAAQPESAQGVDYAAETEVSEECVRAWRMALAGKVPEAMKALEALDKKYPGMKTVTNMKGQIQEHAGNKELAVKYYRAAVVGDEFDAMKVFKLAEMERKSAKTQKRFRIIISCLRPFPTLRQQS